MVRRSPLLLVLLAAACGRGEDAPATERDTPPVAVAPAPDTSAPGDQALLVPGDVDQNIPAPSGDLPVASPGAVAPSGSAAPPPDPVVAGGGVPAVGTDATEILARAERAYEEARTMEANFTQNLHNPLLGVTRNSRGVMYHQAPDRFAMRFTEPEGDLIVADGTFLWMYHPSADSRQVIRYRLGPGGAQIDLQREFLSDATSRYHATRTGAEPVGGRTAHALTLVPRGPSVYRQIRIWVDAQDYLVRRFEIQEENEQVRLLELSSLRRNVTIPATVFQFTVPPGAQVFDP